MTLLFLCECFAIFAALRGIKPFHARLAKDAKKTVLILWLLKDWKVFFFGDDGDGPVALDAFCRQPITAFV
jgi:hypothetical protein